MSWNLAGYYPDSALINISEGDNDNQMQFVDPLPETVINLKFNVWDLFDTTAVPGALVYYSDAQGNFIDSVRTNANGFALIENMGQNTTYDFGTWKENHKAWENISITTPTTTSLNDTLTFEKNATLVPDTVHLDYNNTDVYISTSFLKATINRFNIDLALNDTIYKHLDPSFSSTQVANAHQWAMNYEARTTIPTRFVSTASSYPILNYNPYTTTPELVTVNVTPETSNCQEITYTLTSGEQVNTGANITTSFLLERQVDKEDGRMFGLKENDGEGPSGMNSIPTDMTNEDSGTIQISYNLAKSHFKHGKHDINITVMQDLVEEPTMFPTKSSNSFSSTVSSTWNQVVNYFSK